VSLEIGHRKFDGQVDNVGSPGDLRINGASLNPKKRGPMFFLIT